jgi:hypothetical protein
MTKMMRKYNKWMIVGFGVLLMLAFSGQPIIERIGQAHNNRKIGRINGEPLRAAQLQRASQEIHAFSRLAQIIPFFDVGIDGHDDVHWLLLTREAGAAGLIGEPDNGRDFLDDLAVALSHQVFGEFSRSNYQFLLERFQAQQRNEGREFDEGFLKQIQSNVITQTLTALAEAGLQGEAANEALAKLHGVHQLRQAFASAPRLSDRAAHSLGKREHDAAIGDFLFIPASSLTAGIADPDEQTLLAQFERYRGTRPGEGDYGVGYLLPKRVKLEYLKLDRAAIEQAITIDPVDVNKYYRQNRDRFPGEYAAERPNIERHLRSTQAENIMKEAHTVVQREVQKVTRHLETQGRVRKLPANWHELRPRLQDIAQAIVDHMQSQRQITIPAPQVVVLEDWQTQDDLSTLPEIGQSALRHGGAEAPFTEVVFWVHELGGSGFLAVQTGLPVTEAPLTDYNGDRYYFTILDTRQESPPDGIAEIRERIVDDFKRITAFEQIKGDLERLEQVAVADGLAKLAEMHGLKPAMPESSQPPDPQVPPPADPVHSGVRVSRAQGAGSEPALQDPTVRGQIMDEISRLDPLTPPEQIPADQATVVVAAPQQLGVAIFRVTALQPVTLEAVQYSQNDQSFTQAVLAAEQLRDRMQDAFSLEALLKRNSYFFGDRRVSTPEELRRSEES